MLKRVLYKKAALLLTMAALMTAVAADAVPAYNKLMMKKQPDGTTIQYRIVGDEHCHYLISEDGYLLHEDENGAFRYATWQNNGMTAPCSQLAHTSELRTQQELSLLEQLGKPDLNQLFLLRRNIQKTPLAHASRPDITFPTKGECRGLIFLVEFSDCQFSMNDPLSYYQNMMNLEGFSEDGGTGSARDYFISQSNSQFIPTFDVVGPIRLPNTMRYYGANDAYGNDKNPDQMVIQACQGAQDSLGIDFSQYDYDNDGSVDFVFIIYAGYGENYGAPAYTIWPHAGTLSIFDSSLTLNNKAINMYACSCELLGRTGSETDGIGVFCHEFGHVLGLKDAYNIYNAGSEQMGVWDIMDHGSYLNNSRTPPNYSAFERFSLGWLDFVEIDTPSNEMELPELGSSNKAYRISTEKDNEYFTLENRQQKGWDAFHPGKGLMIIHINYDEQRWMKNTVNSGSSPCYDLVEADNLGGNGNINALYPTETNNMFTDYSTPNSHSWSGKKTGKGVTDIRDDDGIIKFRFMKDQLVRPELLPADSITSESFVAQWNAVEDANYYRLDVQEILPDSLDMVITDEDFSGFKEGSYPSGSIADVSSSLDNYMSETGWTGYRVFQSGGYARIGSYKASGWLQTYKDVSKNDGHFMVAVKALAPIGKNVNFTVSAQAEEATESEAYTLTATSDEQDFVLHFHHGTSRTSIKIQSDLERIFLNDLRILSDSVKTDEVWSVGAKKWSFDHIEGTSYKVSRLEPDRSYSYEVTAFSDNDILPSIASVSGHTTTLSATSGISGLPLFDDIQSVCYYDLTGRKCEESSRGVLIRKTIYKRGETITQKVINR